MLDPLTITVISATFLLAGLVKGVVGLGLPTISLALLVASYNLTTAMAVLIFPSLVTNVWQAAVGGHLQYLLQRIWPFLLMASTTVWVGALALSRVDLELLSMLLGGLLIAYAMISLGGFRMSTNERYEPWAGSLLGIVNGILTGMTGSFAIPGIMYLQSIGLDRNQLVQAMGMLFSVSTLALAIALQQHDLFSFQLGALSILAVLPAILGMWIGQHIRKALSEDYFRKVFYISILLLGIYIMAKSYLL